MLRSPNRPRWSRRGTTLALSAAMMPILVGLVTISIDTGMIAVARSQLATAADAAALAGAGEIYHQMLQANSSTPSLSASTVTSIATSAAAKNTVLAYGPTGNPFTLQAGDVTLKTGSYPWGITATAYLGSGHGNDAVPGFFGAGSTSLSITTTAVAHPSMIGGFRASGPDGSSGTNSANLLPIVLDVTTYKKMIANKTSDHYSYNSSTNSVTAGTPDGLYESKLYPDPSGSPGNWGTIKVGVSNNSTSTLGDQIRNGITPDQLATFPNGTISLEQTDNSTSPPTPYHTFGGNPGISAGIKDDLTSIIGKPVYIPIYDANGGNGNNAWYRVIKFAPARIVAVSFQGNPKYVIIQPTGGRIDDPTTFNRTLTQAQAASGTGLAGGWTKWDPVVIHLTR